MDGGFKNQIKFENMGTLLLSLCGLEKQIDLAFYVQHVCTNVPEMLNNVKRKAL